MKEENTYNPDLINQWAHSMEEDDMSAGIIVFRPKSFKSIYPPKPFRQSFELQEKYKSIWLELMPDDSIEMINGSWSYDSKNKILEVFYPNEETRWKFKLITVDKDIMKVKAIE